MSTMGLRYERERACEIIATAGEGNHVELNQVPLPPSLPCCRRASAVPSTPVHRFLGPRSCILRSSSTSLEPLGFSGLCRGTEPGLTWINLTPSLRSDARLVIGGRPRLSSFEFSHLQNVLKSPVSARTRRGISQWSEEGQRRA